MAIEHIKGNLLDAFDLGHVNVIGHCCNAQGVMRSGIAKSIKERYPSAFGKYHNAFTTNESIFGASIGVRIGWESDNRKVYNLVGQLNYGYDGKRYLNYGALGCAFGMMEQNLYRRDVIGFPYLMGCDRAGGDFEIVLEMIEFYFEEYQVKIYQLEN